MRAATWRRYFTATHCNTLQHTATHCSTLHHIMYGMAGKCAPHFGDGWTLPPMKCLIHMSDMTHAYV